MSKTDHDQEQLRLGFETSKGPLSMELVLAGLTILIEPEADKFTAVWNELHAAGIKITATNKSTITFSVKDLKKLRNLGPEIKVMPGEDLKPLYNLTMNPTAGEPADLTRVVGDELRLSWFDGEYKWDEYLPEGSVGVLMHSDLPFVAGNEAWQALKRKSNLPVLIGKAKVNLDNFIEIHTTKPQLVETSPLPGLFKIDDTHFGMPLALHGALDENPGFLWEDGKPEFDDLDFDSTDLSINLKGAQVEEYESFIHDLHHYKSRVLVWESGLGRRVFALTSLEAVNGWPTMIITTPDTIWNWQRHLDLLGKTYSLIHDKADAFITTYSDIRTKNAPASIRTIIFDNIISDESMKALNTKEFARLQNIDAYRIAIAAAWPEEASLSNKVMSHVRPREFIDKDIKQRYPNNHAARSEKHIGSYLSWKMKTTRTPAVGVRKTSVVTVTLNEAQKDAINELMQKKFLEPQDTLRTLLEIITAGAESSLSPKISKALQLVETARNNKHSVLVATRHQKAAVLLKNILRPRPVTIISEGEAQPQRVEPITICRYDRSLPDLRGFHEIIVLDYPWSMLSLEHAVGGAADNHGPQQITCIHAENTIEDRLAILATQKRELGGTLDDQAPTLEEISWLLTPRSFT